MTATIFITRDDAELEVEAEFDYHPPCRGRRDSMGVPEEPDYDAEMEFVGATCGGVAIELTKKEIDQAEQKSWDQE